MYVLMKLRLIDMAKGVPELRHSNPSLPICFSQFPPYGRKATQKIHTPKYKKKHRNTKNTRNSLGAVANERRRLVAEPKRSIARQIKILEPHFYCAHCSFVTPML